MFLLKCPRCRKAMKYQGRDSILTGKKKACVFCNHSFSVRKNIIKRY